MTLVQNATNIKVNPVGQLGRNDTGLLLFTNDPDIGKKFGQAQGRSGRLYHVELSTPLKGVHFEAIKAGMEIEDRFVEVDELSYVHNAPKSQLGIRLKQSNVNIVRQLFTRFEYEVVRMDCVAIGPLTKKDLPRGHWKVLSKAEITHLILT